LHFDMDDSEEVCPFIDIILNNVDNPTIWIIYLTSGVMSSITVSPLFQSFTFVHQ
jgi:hypothetical protein